MEVGKALQEKADMAQCSSQASQLSWSYWWRGKEGMPVCLTQAEWPAHAAQSNWLPYTLFPASSLDRG